MSELAFPLFELGFIKVGGSRTIACEEISVKVSQENQVRHVCDQILPVDLHPVKKKTEFTFKKPKLLENDLLFYLYTHYMTFDIYLYRIRTNVDPELYMILRACLIDNMNFGNFDGTKPVTEEVNGTALYYEFASGMSAYKDSIRSSDLQDIPGITTSSDNSPTNDVNSISERKSV